MLFITKGSFNPNPQNPKPQPPCKLSQMNGALSAHVHE